MAPITGMFHCWFKNCLQINFYDLPAPPRMWAGFLRVQRIIWWPPRHRRRLTALVGARRNTILHELGTFSWKPRFSSKISGRGGGRNFCIFDGNSTFGGRQVCRYGSQSVSIALGRWLRHSVSTLQLIVILYWSQFALQFEFCEKNRKKCWFYGMTRFFLSENVHISGNFPTSEADKKFSRGPTCQ